MFARFARIRSTVLIASFAFFAVESALAGPGAPLPPFPPGTGNLIAAMGPGAPLPPFPPGTGNVSTIG